MNKIIEIRKRLCRAVLLCMVAMVSGVLLQGCVHDKELLGCPEGAPGTLTLKFNVLGSQPNRAATRAVLPGENNVKDIAVWLFDVDSKCIYYRHVKAGEAQPTGQDWTSGHFNVSLPNVPELTAVAEMYIVANAEDNLNSWGAAGPTDQVGKSVDDILWLFTTKASSGENAIESPLPMGSFWERAGAAVMSSPHTVGLGRSIARVNVTVKVDEAYSPGLAAKLKLDKAKVTLSNLVEYGCAVFEAERSPDESFKYAGIPYDNRDYSAYAADPSKGIPIRFYSQTQPVAAVVGAIPPSYATLPFYINQRSSFTYQDPNKDKKVSVRLQVPYIDGVGVENDDNFYKAEIYNTDAPDEDRKYFIHPNRSYNLTLTIVGLGNEGVKAEIDCLPWDVEDKDLDAGKSITLSNSEFVSYADAGTEMTAVTVSSFGKTPGAVTATAGITVTQGGTFPAYSTGTDVKIKFAAGTDAGTLTITQDGASKTVTVTRRDQLYAWDEEVALFADAKYTSVEPIAADGFKIATQKKDYATADAMTAGSSVESAGNGFYFYTTNGFSLTAAPAVTSTTFMLTEGGKKTRMVLRRDGATSTLLNNFYVGTFHKHNHTGERIIQQAGAKFNGTWAAGVASGKEWIRLDPTGNFTLPATAVNATTDTPQLSADAKSSISTQNGEIRFRVGLTGANPNAPEAGYTIGKPRYGLVLVAYKEGGVHKYNPIFVRQGEDADYVYPPVGNRAQAVKWSPYNMNDPSGNVTQHSSIFSYPQVPASNRTPASNYLVNYPSEGGYIYTWGAINTARRAFTPLGPTHIADFRDGLVPNYLDTRVWSIVSSTYEVCPDGYRRPSLGPTNVGISTFDINSELQSSLIEDRNTNINVIYRTNQLFGYYADGLFDRYQVQANGLNVFPTNTYACKGHLFYNKATNAHLFLPNSNGRYPHDAPYGVLGWNMGHYWTTTTSAEGYDAFALRLFHSPEGDFSKASKAFGFSIRCVKD